MPADRLPRVLFVGRGRYSLPLSDSQARKWQALEPVLDYRVLGAAEPSSGGSTERFRLSGPTRPAQLDGALFQARLPARIARQIRDFEPDAIVCGDPFICAAALAGRRLARRTTPVIAEVHGDWRTFTRSYGAERRRWLSRPADAVAAAAIRGADTTRAVSTFTSDLIEEVRGEPATATFQAYSDLSAFRAHPVAPLPDRPTALFVGMLEAYKNIDGLAAAWRTVAETVPEARLVIVGKGSRQHVVDSLLREHPNSVEHYPRLSPAEVAAALDRATLLVLPSWPEGLGLVVIEAFARGRGVVVTAAGGLLDLVDDGVEGLLVPRADEAALAAALVRVLSDRALAEGLGASAHARYADWHSTPELFAERLRALVDLTVSRSGPSDVRNVFITQVVDADHPALGQTIDMIDALAARSDEVVVLCDHVGRHACAPNVRLLAFGAGSRVGRGLAFERLLAREIRRGNDRPAAVLAHMVPVFVTLAAPLCKLHRIPLGLWYTHWHADRSLRVATRLADVVLSVDEGSFPLRTPKLRGIGHAIDLTRFPPPMPPSSDEEARPLRLLALGRMAPWKGYTTLLAGLEVATAQGLDAELEIRGPALKEAEVAHLAELERIVAASAVLRARVRFERPAAREAVPGLLAAADVVVSATQPEGGETLDKVVYEAAAAGVPVVSSNPLLDAFLGDLPVPLRFVRRDPDDLAAVLLAVDAAGPVQRAEIGLELRRRVEAGHSVDSWADAVVEALTGGYPRGRDRIRA